MQGVIYRAFMASAASKVTALEPVLINLGEFFFGRLAISKEPKLKVPAGCVANPSKFAGQFFITAISPYRVALYESKGVIGVRNMVGHIADEGYEILDGSGRVGNADAVFAHEMFQDDIRRVPDVLERVMYPFDGKATSRKKMLFSPEKKPDGGIDKPDSINQAGVATWSVMGGRDRAWIKAIMVHDAREGDIISDLESAANYVSANAQVLMEISQEVSFAARLLGLGDYEHAEEMIRACANRLGITADRPVEFGRIIISRASSILAFAEGHGLIERCTPGVKGMLQALALGRPVSLSMDQVAALDKAEVVHDAGLERG